ncbi:DUF1697 domain-containing protein [Streptomyces xanthii]|uniref:DUF1697 domain-containing protein n=1 Tax=Streptomyces xanthii TaxID=2768069 RepID=A0A7H1BKL0_9ACTN|nr:DUF1697 domain-containing protein [Streptomyces xanthii]QNS09265.1 DUF1697 domain-containing protein [Streptomyces xanthii]
MTTDQIHIAFLRAVNVGSRKVEMARLREVLTGLGLGSVRTYIASGNAFFTSADSDPERLVALIERALEDAFGFEIPTILRTADQLRAELAAAPFGKTPPAADERFSMLYGSAPLTGTDLPVRSPKGDWEVLGTHGGTAFVRWRLLGGRPVNPAPVIEKMFGVRATGRFFHTSQKILAAAEKN